MMNEEEVKIQVFTPEIKSEMAGTSKFYVYHLKGNDNHGQIDIIRRYSDFDLLREILVKRWPGCCIPSLPEKKTIGNNQSAFLEGRRYGLEIFLIVLSRAEYLWESEEMQLFLRNTTGDSDKALNALAKEHIEKLLTRYTTIFSKFQKREVSVESMEKINLFNVFLKEIGPMLNRIEEMTESMQLTARKFVERNCNLIEFLLPDYETNTLFVGDEKKQREKLVFANGKLNGVVEIIEKYKALQTYHPILKILEEIKREKRQILAFGETLKIKDEFEANKQKSIGKVKDIELDAAKINSGKQSFLSKIKKQSKEEQLQINQSQLERAKAEELINCTLCRIIGNIVAVEIDRFKSSRQKAYYKLLRDYSKCELDIANIEKELWVCVGKHECIGKADNYEITKEVKKQIIEEKYDHEETHHEEHESKPETNQVEEDL